MVVAMLCFVAVVTLGPNDGRGVAGIVVLAVVVLAAALRLLLGTSAGSTDLSVVYPDGSKLSIGNIPPLPAWALLYRALAAFNARAPLPPPAGEVIGSASSAMDVRAAPDVPLPAGVPVSRQPAAVPDTAAGVGPAP